MISRFVFASALLILVSHLSLWGQIQINAGNGGNEPYEAIQLTSEIVFDGLPYEEAWQSMQPFDLHQYEPIYGGQINDKTELFLTYDSKYLYMAGRMFAPPEHIMDNGKTRDLFKPNMDYFGLVLDTFNDYENALGFMTAPSGLRLDLTIANDAEGQGFPLNTTWNTFWDSKTVKTDSAWYAEVRIPWSSLRFQDEEGEVTMGFIIRRWMPTKSQVLMYPRVPNDLGGWANWKPSQARRITFQGVYSQKPLYIAPYVLGGLQWENALNESADGYTEDFTPDFNAGLDLKYGITSNLTMDITINPDFAQVEADDQQVNLTRFSLFFPEKRLFFQERASTFDFDMGGPNTIFYSRRIGLDDGGIIPIYAGVRLNGRIGGTDIGFLDMQAASTDEVKSTNFGVLRLRKQVINKQSYIGTMVANKIDTDGDYNTAVGVDGIFRFWRNNFFNINYAQTYEPNGITTPWSMDHSKIRTLLERRNVKGLGYSLGFNRTGASYNPEVGFENRSDASRFGNRISWGWLPTNENSFLYSHRLSLAGSLWKNNSDWSTQSSEIGFEWEFDSRNNWRGGASIKSFEEGVDESFDIGEAEIPEGRYYFRGVEAMVSTPFSVPIRTELNTYVGSFFDGSRFGLGISPTWTITPSLETEFRYQYNKGEFQERGESFNIHLASIKTTVMVSNAISASLFLQYNNDADVLGTNFRIRYNPREGNDLYIVFNDNTYTDRFSEIPTLPRFSTRALVVKYTYTFTTAK